MKILLGVSGSVAAVLANKMYEQLSTLGEVRIVFTDTAFEFMPPSQRERLYKSDGTSTPIWTDEDEWATYHRGPQDAVLHIELRKWADVFVIAPLSANSLGKIANGISDNLLTCVALAWDFSKPIVVAPAMNTMMWTNPATQRNINTLKHMGYTVVPPISKTLVCGDTGIGAMAKIQSIVEAVNDADEPWEFPLDGCVGIPVGRHPGAFAAIRKHDVHTGIDLYCEDGDPIFACTEGTVVDIKQFTGPEIGHDWWNSTDAIVIDNGRNFILYGECQSVVKVGDTVRMGQLIGRVRPVLPASKLRPDIPGHSVSMLHLELLRRNPDFSDFKGSNGFMTWDLDKPQPYDLLNPTRLLLDAEGSPKELHYENPDKAS
jgi:phosphopantothenoylcysteine decarboxylase